MSYRVVVAHEAEKILDRMDRTTEKRIRTRIKQLAHDPFDPRLSAPLKERPGVNASNLRVRRMPCVAEFQTTA